MATKSIAWQTGSGNITLTYQGQGDGTINVQSDDNNLGSARSQVVTVQTVGGAITRNLTISQAACPFPVNTTKSYSYTGSYQEVVLPAGQYKLQCWGAQGGSNAAASSYGITAKTGGKGGYSEGIITLSQKTTVRVYVGGQGSSSAGGFNGGGTTTGSSSYSSGTSGQPGYQYGTSRMGGGGGATDIRLSDGALLSRMIVAGGGSGGAGCYKIATTESTIGTYSPSQSGPIGTNNTFRCKISGAVAGHKYKFTASISPSSTLNGMQIIYRQTAAGSGIDAKYISQGEIVEIASHPGYDVYVEPFYPQSTSSTSSTVTVTAKEVVTSSSNQHSNGYVGGGTSGGGYSSTYQGKQNAAGSGGSFGQGANQTTTGYRYCSGAGGGGWYGGGGGQKSDSSMSYVQYMGGGSGWVNIAANTGNRPSGYTGLELDSGETKDGNTSFPNTAGTGNETGHSGNGYAKITRLA